MVKAIDSCRRNNVKHCHDSPKAKLSDALNFQKNGVSPFFQNFKGHFVQKVTNPISFHFYYEEEYRDSHQRVG